MEFIVALPQPQLKQQAALRSGWCFRGSLPGQGLVHLLNPVDSWLFVQVFGSMGESSPSLSQEGLAGSPEGDPASSAQSPGFSVQMGRIVAVFPQTEAVETTAPSPPGASLPPGVAFLESAERRTH